MLHQYSDQPFTDLVNHYSTQLNSCSSYLLNQSRAETPKANDLNNYSCERNEFLRKECTDEYDILSLDVDSVVAMGKLVESNSSDCCKAFEDTVMVEKVDDTNHEYIKEEQNNNNVLEIVEDRNQKTESHQKDGEIIPSGVGDSIIVESKSHDDDEPAHKNDDDESKDSVHIASNAAIACELCDENESTFRLPGFHQAFGSTEIGRFVHQKDFIEQINQQTSFTLTKSLPVTSLPCSSSSVVVNNSIISASNSPKIRSRYNKRLKVPPHSLPPPSPAVLPPPTDIARNVSSSWSTCEFEAGDPTTVNSATNFQSTNCTNGNFFNGRPKDIRSRRNQYGSTGFSPSYCNGDDYYNCSSSYYYGNGTCSESVNCDYYTSRYQQNSSHYHNGYSTYSNLYTGYANGYHYSKDHSERYNSTGGSSGDITCSMSQNCQIDKYHYSPYNEEHHQIPYHYGEKQSNSSISYHQYQPPYTPHNQHQLPSQPSYNNYNGYNSYAPISSFSYY